MRPFLSGASDYVTGDRFAVWRCAACGSGRTEPKPGDLGRHYPARYRQYNGAIAAILRLFYRRRVARWARGFAAPGSAFEIGCGDGLMLATLRDFGWQVAGSERTEDAARLPRERFGLRVTVGDISDLPQGERFDLVVMSQVLEHLPDPAVAVASLAARLRPGGRLIIGVPNFASWQARASGTGWFHLDVPRHLHHFTPAGLSVLLGRHGLVVTRFSYVSAEHDPYGWIQSLLNRLDRARPNRLTRLLMRLDAPDAANLLHLAAGCLLGLLALPLSVASWIAGRGAVMEVTSNRRD